MHSVQNRLLSGISALTIAAVITGPALAADVVYDVPSPPAVEYPAQGTEAWVSLEGRFNMFASNAFDLGDSYINYYAIPFDPSPDTGWGGSLELGVKPAGMEYDFVGRFTYLRSSGSDSYSYFDYVYPYADIDAEADVDETLILADFEVGRELGVGTRVHAGVRFAHHDSSQTGFYYNSGGPGYYAAFTEDSTFTGIGPRIGIDQRFGLTENLSLDLSAAGAAIYGKREGEVAAYTYNIYGPGPDTFNDSISESTWVLNAEASAGLTFTQGNASLTAGYRMDFFKDISVHYFSDYEGDYFAHGPFLKATFKLGG